MEKHIILFLSTAALLGCLNARSFPIHIPGNNNNLDYIYDVPAAKRHHADYIYDAPVAKMHHADYTRGTLDLPPSLRKQVTSTASLLPDYSDPTISPIPNDPPVVQAKNLRPSENEFPDYNDPSISPIPNDPPPAAAVDAKKGGNTGIGQEFPDYKDPSISPHPDPHVVYHAIASADDPWDPVFPPLPSADPIAQPPPKGRGIVPHV